SRMPTNHRALLSFLHRDHACKRRGAMKCLMICLMLAVTIVGATPANAQFWFGAGPVALRVGPPPPWWRRHYVVRDYAYVEPACRFIRERIRRPNGRVVVREREICY